MAVFPDRIVLKNSADGDASIRLAIASGASAEIVPGELVIGRENGYISLYSIDASGSVASLAEPTLESLSDVDLPSYSTISDGAYLVFDAASQKWVDSSNSVPGYDVSGNVIGDLSDVSNGAASSRSNKDVLYWNYSTQEYVGGSINLEDLNDIGAADPFTANQALLSNGSEWVAGNIDYSMIQNAPQSATDLQIDIGVEDLDNVTLTNLATNDILFYNGSYWENKANPPADMSGGVLTDIGDVTASNVVIGAVAQYSPVDSGYIVAPLDYSYVSNAPTDLGDFTNGPGYLTSIANLNLDNLTDVTTSSPSEGQMLIYRSGVFVNENGPVADVSNNSIGDLNDVTYYQPGVIPGQLTIDSMGEIIFDDPTTSGGLTEKLSTTSDFGFGISQLRDSDSTGSAVHVDRGRGVTLRSDINIVRVSGKPDITTNQPELRWETGDSGASTPTGEYIGLKISNATTESTTYIFPTADGNVGDILATDGSGGLSWFSPNVLSGSALNDLSDVDTATIAPTDGDALLYNATAGLFLPGQVNAPALGTSSIDELQDVDTTTTTPVDGQGLGWDSATNNWIPKDVLPSLDSKSIDDLADVDTSTTTASDGQALVWDATGSKWRPSTVTAVGGSQDLNSVLGNGNSTSRGMFLGQGTADYLTGLTNTVLQIGDSTANGNSYVIGLGEAGSLSWTNTLGNSGDVILENTQLASDVKIKTEGEFSVTQSTNEMVRVDLGGVMLRALDGTSTLVDRLETTTTGVSITGKAVSTVSTAPGDAALTLATKDYVDTHGGGGGGGGAVVDRTSESQTASSGAITYTGIGQSGTLVSVGSDLDAWVVFYGSAADRTADASRTFNVDPTPGSGVLAEVYVAAGTTVKATPGTVYYNADTVATDAIYLAVRTNLGANQNATITTTVYADSNSDTLVTKADFQAVTAAATDFADYQTRVAAL